MADNEDYLDNLLKEAAKEIAPDSAMSKVMEINKRKAEEEVLQEEEPALDVPSEEFVFENTLSLEEEPILEDTLTLGDESVTEGQIMLDDTLAIDNESVLDDTLALDDEAVLDDTLALDNEPVLDDTLALDDEPVLDDALAIDNEPMIDDTPALDDEPVFEDELTSSDDSAAEEQILVEDAVAGVEDSDYTLDADTADLLAGLSDSLEEEVSETTAAEAPFIEEFVSEEPIMEEPTMEESLTEEAVSETIIEEPAIEEPVSDELVLEEAVEEFVLEGTVTEESVSEESVIEETVTEESVSEEPVLEETVIEDFVSEEPISEENVSEESTSDDFSDIDSLLKSDYAGEIDMTDISSLLDSAEAFANGEEAQDDVQGDSLQEETEEAIDVDSLLSDIGMLDDSEQTENSDLSFTEDEISSMLDSAANVEESSNGEIEIDVADIGNLESEFGIFDKPDVLGDAEGSDGELDEISNLLKSLDSNEISDSGDIDMLDLLNEAVSKQEEIERTQISSAPFSEDDAPLEDPAEETGKKKGLFSKFKKKKANDSDDAFSDLEPKKQNFIQRLIAFLTAEEESEEESLLNPTDISEPGSLSDGFEDVQGENKEILNEIDNEEEGGKKGKKKGKKKKGKAQEKAESDEDSEDGESTEGKGKKKKAKKDKAEKKPLILDIDTGKPLSKKNVSLIFVLAATLLVALLLVVSFLPKAIYNSSARKAYYMGDYETTYNTFYGNKKLSESDQILFDRSYIILKVSHKYDAFCAYNKMDMKVEALDQLLQGVNNYEKWLFTAESCGATDEFNEQYRKVLGALNSVYGLSEEDAKAVNALESDIEYSLMCDSIAYGTAYIDPNAPLPGPFVPPTDIDETQPVFSDMLAEEGN